MKKLLGIMVLGLLVCGLAEAAKDKKKDKSEDTPKCIYCEKFEKLEKWPTSERPKAYIFEEIKYPADMFKKNEGKTSKSRQAKSGQKVYIRFVKGKAQLNKNHPNMVSDMAYLESLFNEMLNDPQSKLKTSESLITARDAMRMSLQISPKAKASEAVMKFWTLGKMMKKGRVKIKKKPKIDLEIAERVAVLTMLKKQIVLTKINAQRAATVEAQKEIDKLK